MSRRQLSYTYHSSDAGVYSPQMNRGLSSSSTMSTASIYEVPRTPVTDYSHTADYESHYNNTSGGYGFSETTTLSPTDTCNSGSYDYPDISTYGSGAYTQGYSYDVSPACYTSNNYYSLSSTGDSGGQNNRGGSYDNTQASSPRTHEAPSGYNCLAPNCDANPFRRKADLDRHYAHRHAPVEMKPKFNCDWSKCTRSKEPFHRLDHCRDHYRDYHKEDLARKSGEKREWYQERRVNNNWWRCSKCLKRNRVYGNGNVWECSRPGCTGVCDITRRQLRGFSR